MPWTRGSTDFIRRWVVAGPIACRLEEDCVGGEGAVRPDEAMELAVASEPMVATAQTAGMPPGMRQKSSVA